ncbi:MAG: protein kinase [Cyanobacteria bacterium CRU_2_1]|nr:protein kinase [Cyanobacteria bacterium RU_5_0]NJR60746.1 protein kinase [Cyanobacteria bacterium CRU_2_1]
MSSLIHHRYRLIKSLGSGSHNRTFLGEDTRSPSPRRCLIKQFELNHAKQVKPELYPTMRQVLLREAASLKTLSEGNDQIPLVYDYFEDEDQFWLVEEWIEGESLADRLHQQKFSESEVRRLLSSLLSVLEYAHNHNYLHRNILPHTIVLRHADQQPVLVSFNTLLKDILDFQVSPDDLEPRAIAIGFKPSEQRVGRFRPERDLYSLGMTAIASLTGKLPHELESDLSTGEIHWRSHSHISDHLARVLDRAIQHNWRDRYSSAKAMLNDLQSQPEPNAAIEEEAPTLIIQVSKLSRATTSLPSSTLLSSTTPSSIQSATTQPPKSRLLYGLIALGMVSAVAIVSFLLNQFTQSLSEQSTPFNESTQP